MTEGISPYSANPSPAGWSPNIKGQSTPQWVQYLPAWSQPTVLGPLQVFRGRFGVCSCVAGTLIGICSLSTSPISSPACSQTTSFPLACHRCPIMLWRAVLTGRGVSWLSIPCPIWKAADISISVTAGRGWQCHVVGPSPAMESSRPGLLLRLCDLEKYMYFSDPSVPYLHNASYEDSEY